MINSRTMVHQGFGLNNILFTVTLPYYDLYKHTIFLGFDGKR